MSIKAAFWELKGIDGQCEECVNRAKEKWARIWKIPKEKIVVKNPPDLTVSSYEQRVMIYFEEDNPTKG